LSFIALAAPRRGGNPFLLFVFRLGERHHGLYRSLRKTTLFCLDPRLDLATLEFCPLVQPFRRCRCISFVPPTPVHSLFPCSVPLFPPSFQTCLPPSSPWSYLRLGRGSSFNRLASREWSPSFFFFFSSWVVVLSSPLSPSSRRSGLKSAPFLARWSIILTRAPLRF